MLKKTVARLLPGTIGAQKEAEAEKYLQSQGLRPLSRNYRCKAGEIDLIMEDGETLVFVEVRYRKHSTYGSAAESINTHKQKKLINAANHYLQQSDLLHRQACRFDAVCIEGTGRTKTCQWIRNIFS